MALPAGKHQELPLSISNRAILRYRFDTKGACMHVCACMHLCFHVCVYVCACAFLRMLIKLNVSFVSAIISLGIIPLCHQP